MSQLLSGANFKYLILSLLLFPEFYVKINFVKHIHVIFSVLFLIVFFYTYIIKKLLQSIHQNKVFKLQRTINYRYNLQLESSLYSWKLLLNSISQRSIHNKTHYCKLNTFFVASFIGIKNINKAFFIYVTMFQDAIVIFFWLGEESLIFE